MVTIRQSRPNEGQRLVEIWRGAVDATHDFLSPQDRREIDAEVRDFLPKAQAWVAVDGSDKPIGFMLLNDGHIDALFIDPEHRGGGIGRALVEHARSLHPAVTTDVNAQNGQAVEFYRHMGFVPTGSSDTDGQGRPYPLIFMHLAGVIPSTQPWR